MMILTNGLTDVVDEGFLKVANSLVKRLKKAHQEIEIVSYERKSEITDTFINANKFMSNKSVRDACKKHGDVLYIPFPVKKWVMALRVYILSRFTKKLRVVLVLKTPVNAVSKLLLKQSGAGIVVFSREAADFYGDIVGAHRVTYLKTGVDTRKFTPVSQEQAAALKEKYGFDPNKKLVLHVGHLNEGRNIRLLTEISDDYQVLLVTSTQTQSEVDLNLKNDLLAQPNIRIIQDYIPQIQEIYQMSDVYFFPVVESGRCIDVPLSCMEAAACGKPVVTTPFGEMRELIGKEGIYQLSDFSAMTINKAITDAVQGGGFSGASVVAYDWDHAISYFSKAKGVIKYDFYKEAVERNAEK